MGAGPGFLIRERQNFHADCCATHEERRHVNSIDMMDGHYARVRTTDALIAELQAL